MTVQHPLLVRGGLTGRIYVVTAYTRHGDGRIVSRRKFDVTDQFDELLQAEDAPLQEDDDARDGYEETK